MKSRKTAAVLDPGAKAVAVSVESRPIAEKGLEPVCSGVCSARKEVWCEACTQV